MKLDTKELLAKMLSRVFPLKVMFVTHSFTFSNSSNSATVAISTLTGGVVTASTLKNVVANLKGAAIYAGIDGSGNVFLANRTNYTGTLTANLLIFYS